jgi:cytochrome c
MMTNEFRIVAMVFGLSTSSALARDIAAGETPFRKCLPCHAIGTDARNKTGPLLNGIEGRKCGIVSGYIYSDGNRNCAFTWDEAIILDYIGNRKAKNSRDQKVFGGIKDEIEANNLWAYLRQFGPDGRPK